MVGVALVLLMANIAPPATPGPPLIPAPAEIHSYRGRFELEPGLTILMPVYSDPRAAEIPVLLREGLREFAGVEATVGMLFHEGKAAEGIALYLDPSAFPGEPEAYRIEVGRFAEITASDPRGLLWGVQTFLQCIETSSHGPIVRYMTVTDRPRRPWRGLMLDPVRSFLDLDFVRRTIRVMSAYKLNVLHIHLIDDQAWRIQSKAWPKCNRPGEPVYTQAELRELAAYAARYGVEIVPELDVPGHSMTAVNAYPELDCERRTRPMNEAIFCSGRPFTWEFIDKLVAEAASVFPSDYIHMGADEPYAIKRWASCPDCQARMKELGVTTLDALYHTFVADLDKIAKRHGKKLIVWNDAFHPGVAPMPPRDILVDAWIDFETVEPLAAAGYPILNSSSGPLYLASFGWREGLPLAAVLGWNATLFPHPRPERGDPAPVYRALPAEAKILGGHASAWATEQTLVERRLYPRLLAVAEDLWAESRPAGAAEFEARFRAGHRERLHRLGVPEDEALPEERPFPAGEGGVIVPAAAPSGEFVSAKSYQDFRLTFELRAAASKNHTGVFIRCVSGRDQGATPAGFSISASPPPGLAVTSRLNSEAGWDKCEVVARGPIVSLTINGGLAWSVVDPAPRAGLIILRSMGSGHEFRDVRLIDLGPRQ